MMNRNRSSGPSDEDTSGIFDEGLLLAFLDGAVDAATRQQIEEAVARNPALYAELERLSRLQNRLAQGLQGSHAPDTMALGEYLLGLLPPDEAAAIERQVAAYPHHAQELAALRGYLADLDLPPIAEAAESWSGRLHSQFTTLVAQLVDTFNGGATLGLAGVRGPEASQRVYQAGEVQVIVDIQESLEQSGWKAILGLTTGLADAEGSTVTLYRQDEMVATAAVDELGNFVFDAVPPAAYTVVLRGMSVEIVVPGVAIE
jgi:hypothetical protein